MHSVWDDRNTELNPIGTMGNKNSIMVDDDTSVSATEPNVWRCSHIQIDRSYIAPI